MGSKQSALLINMLDSSEMGSNKDLKDKGPILLWQGLWVEEFTNSGPRRDKPQTGDRVLYAQGSSMDMRLSCLV